jgi:hypothetical protein
MQQANLGYCCAYGNICSTAKCWKKPDIVHSGKSPPDSTSSTKGGPASCRCTPLNITVFELWNDSKIELLTFLRWLQMSFEPLVRCLDVDNVLRFFTAILLERRVLLRANKYSVLTMVAEAVCHLIYPIKWQLVTAIPD